MSAGCTGASAYMHSSQCIESLQEMFVKWLSSWHHAHLLPRLHHLSFSQESLLTWFMFLVPYIPTPFLLSHLVLLVLLSVPLKLSPYLHFDLLERLVTPLHSLRSTPFSSELRSPWPVIASDLLSTCALRHLTSCWHLLLPTPELSTPAGFPSPNCAFCCHC